LGYRRLKRVKVDKGFKVVRNESILLTTLNPLTFLFLNLLPLKKTWYPLPVFFFEEINKT